MIGISKLYCGTVEASDVLRYGRRSRDLPSHLLQFSQDKKPVVVWNVGQRCNLRCVHCYAHSRDIAYPGELTVDEGGVTPNMKVRRNVIAATYADAVDSLYDDEASE